MVRLLKLLPHIQGYFCNYYVSQSGADFSAPRKSLLFMLFTPASPPPPPPRFHEGKGQGEEGSGTKATRDVGEKEEMIKVGEAALYT